ncbi:hypothetical protein [Kitasatospora cathayae]|uniref:Uncharacterized protein n=1 Tax=Kitasatospora cathayae TaxID=3004092 RepID=A0ABY7QH94_9ACTN|nr:hypothetical protein [Kitasatospora sp. HUAS 3-15]WBP92219.1 hypothetical protein O1G21_41155 [Kitasatospora sp. HUAS 3-15]
MSENEDDTTQTELERLASEAVDTQRRWFDAEAAWTQDSTNRERYEAFIAVGLQLHNHPYWAAAGGNRYEVQKAVREKAAPASDA